MFQSHYNNWRLSRINGINKYIDTFWFESKKLLEIGCAYGDIGNYFFSIGAKVSCCDAKKEYIEEVKNKFPYIKTFEYNANKDLINDNYDIIVHWGTLSHLNSCSINFHLENICSKCQILLLESEVLDSEDSEIIDIKEYGYDQSFDGLGCRPTEKFIENILTKNNMQFINIKDIVLNSDFHRYDWVIKNTKYPTDGLRRFWICWKKDINHFKLKEVIYSNPSPKFKVALYIGGRSKLYDKHLYKLLQNQDIDVFASLNEPYNEDFIKVIKPVSVNFEIYDQEKASYICEGAKEFETWSTYNVCSMFYNNQKAFELIEKYSLEKNIKYDVVIKFRPDIEVENLPDINKITPNTVYFPAWPVYGKYNTNDQLGFGNFQTMKIYSYVYDNMKEYVKKNILFHPETILGYHLQTFNIKIERINYHFSLDPNRK
jgi:hypothetical protein